MQNIMQKLYFILFGGFLTFVLFTGMTFLVKPDTHKPLTSTQSVRYIPFRIEDKPPSLIKREIPKKIKPLEMPKSERSIVTRVEPKRNSVISERGLQVSMSGLKVAIASSASMNPWGSSAGVASGLQPSIRINPTYPIPAARNNIEGFVTLSFDVSEVGKPINIKIIEAKPRGYFESSARRALKKWKYNSESAKNGIESQIVTLAFKLEDEV